MTYLQLFPFGLANIVDRVYLHVLTLECLPAYGWRAFGRLRMLFCLSLPACARLRVFACVLMRACVRVTFLRVPFGCVWPLARVSPYRV